MTKGFGAACLPYSPVFWEFPLSAHAVFRTVCRRKALLNTSPGLWLAEAGVRHICTLPSLLDRCAIH